VIAYLHGFNSSPQSHKAQVLGRFLAGRGLAGQFHCPALPPLATDAIGAVQALMARYPGERWCFVGSSLGGYYATYLAEAHDASAVLVNPAVTPHLGLRAYLGEQRNLHTGEPYRLTQAHLEDWQRLWMPQITASRYLLIVETGDEVLDYREALTRYHGAEHCVVEGGDHSLQSFAQHLPRILAFAGL
jgi:uncharacterized protein